MNVEASPPSAFVGLVQRARLHAALADPGRLRIVDALALGDTTPGALQRRLGLSSNLLAHHLRVLESAGVVARHRSEADRRRTYLRLNPDRMNTLLPDSMLSEVVAVPRVVFVCTANSARSQLASALWQRASDVPVASAGTHPTKRIAAGATAAAKRHRLALQAHIPHALDEVLRDGDYLITVCDHAHEELARVSAAAALHWSVADPVPVGTRQAFDAAYDDLERRVLHLAPHLAPAQPTTA